MVGRLVEQQHVGFLKQDLSQFDTHAPTAAELTGRTLKVGTLKAQSHQGALDFSLVVLSTHHHVAVMFLGELLHQRHIVSTVIVRSLCQLLVHAVDALFQLRDVGKGFLSLLAYRRVILQHHHLRQIADSSVAWNTHRTAGRLLHTTKDFEQRRLAGTVLSDQCYTVAVVYHETGISKQGLHTKLYTKRIY